MNILFILCMTPNNKQLQVYNRRKGKFNNSYNDYNPATKTNNLQIQHIQTNLANVMLSVVSQ